MYSPKIADDLITQLYLLGKAKKKPMTVVVDELLRLALQITRLFEQMNNGGHDESNQSTLADRSEQPKRKIISHEKSVG